MVSQTLRQVLLVFLLCSAAASQVLSFPGAASNRFGSATALDSIQAGQMDMNLFTINSKGHNPTKVQTPSGSVSKLDLAASAKARREYQKGYQALMRNELHPAVEHLTKSITIYPRYVSAHNALGSAYLAMGQNEKARGEFAQAVALDDHLPNSYLNLGCAELALKHYPAAEDALRKASSIAPLDLQLLTALTYAEFVNHDYAATIATAHQVHGIEHRGAAVVHYFAAGAWEAQGNLSEAQHEMETLLLEDPSSASAGKFRQILEEIKTEEATQAEARMHPAQALTVTRVVARPHVPTPEETARRAQQDLQNTEEKNQIAEAEAEPDPMCSSCSTPGAGSISGSNSVVASAPQPGIDFPGTVLRASVDEVAIFFAATDHGKSVTDLTAREIGVRDDSLPPAAILEFRNESQLPLRLGLVIDTSSSIASRFSFEQAAAAKFLQKVITDKNDLAFVVGVNNSVLLVQDFTTDQALTSHAVSQLAPSGGTALWDAIAFAADKLGSHPEIQPVARILVVISDGEDNSSSISLKQAIAHAQHGEVAVYTVSTRDDSHEEVSALLGDHALQTLSALTGGAAFIPGSIHQLNGSLADLQQVIRGRYLVSYKPASFQRDGRYRTVDIEAQKDGRKLKVYARKGYYASAVQPGSSDR